MLATGSSNYPNLHPRKTTPKSRLRLVPIEGLAHSCELKEFAITPPWCKTVYADPEYAATD